MLTHRIAAAACAFALAGCSNETPTLDYTVTIDAAFTSDELSSITAGLDEWKRALRELHLDVTIGRCGTAALRHVCFQPAHDAPNPSSDVVGMTMPGASGDANVALYVDRIRAMGPDMGELTAQTAAHEMGHAMGLKHTSPGELMHTLMAASVSDQAHAPTPEDVSQFWAVRGQ